MIRITWIYFPGLLVFLFFRPWMDAGIGQQAPVFSQYMFHKFIVNPAVAGSEGYSAYSITSRVQWVGFKDAPVTNAISVQTRLLKTRLLLRFNKNKVKYQAPEHGSVGIGIHIFSDRRGLLSQDGIQFTYAYHQKVELKEQLSFGISLNLTQFKVRSDKMRSFQPDPYLNEGNLVSWIPDFNLGVYYTSAQVFLGFSVMQVFQSAFGISSLANHPLRLQRNYHLMGGYRFPLSSDISVEPGFQLKMSDLWTCQLDFGSRWYIRKDVWGGFFYRTGDALVGMVGLRYNKVYLGYAYDYSLNRLQSFSYGTSELIISMKFAEYERKYQWIERF